MNERREARRRRLLMAREAASRAVLEGGRPRGDATEPTPAKADTQSRAASLQIPEHALAALEFQAQRLCRSWHLAKAEGVARRVLSFDPQRPRAWRVLGDIAMRRREWAQAVESFEAALRNRVADPMLWCRSAEALLQLGEYPRAQQRFIKAVTLDASAEQVAGQRARSFLTYYEKAFERAGRLGKGADDGRSSWRKVEVEEQGVAPIEAGDIKTRTLSEKDMKAALAERFRVGARGEIHAPRVRGEFRG